MALLTTERLFWHCGAHTAEPKISRWGPIPPFLITVPKSAVFPRHVGKCVRGAVRCRRAVFVSNK